MRKNYFLKAFFYSIFKTTLIIITKKILLLSITFLFYFTKVDRFKHKPPKQWWWRSGRYRPQQHCTLKFSEIFWGNWLELWTRWQVWTLWSKLSNAPQQCFFPGLFSFGHGNIGFSGPRYVAVCKRKVFFFLIQNEQIVLFRAGYNVSRILG